ncbi:hypothetical protein RhiJN_18870 [Ceratobasidium sp. AG-Ba]|nr:hypothetical protein RhiJN_18870 [Ceratobasidium sp. AG-Ba]
MAPQNISTQPLLPLLCPSVDEAQSQPQACEASFRPCAFAEEEPEPLAASCAASASRAAASALPISSAVRAKCAARYRAAL